MYAVDCTAEVKVAVVEGPDTSMMVEVVSGNDEDLACLTSEEVDADEDEDDEDSLGSV